MPCRAAVGSTSVSMPRTSSEYGGCSVRNLVDVGGVDEVHAGVERPQFHGCSFVGAVGFVGVPHGVELPMQQMLFQSVGVRGGSAPVRIYLPELLEDVLAERIDPGRVLDYETDPEGIGDAYAAIDERRAIKSLVRVGTV
jgi:threonine dehydrogenase-like Zn-dependent dehydrogenase